MAEKLAIWPQILVLCLLSMAWITIVVRNGEEIPAHKHSAGKFTLGLILVVILLGNGGFWKPLGW